VDVRPEDLAKYPVRRRIVTAGNPDIVLCDEQVPIQDVLEKFCDTHVPKSLVGSWKTRCPFAAEHADGGMDPGFRVYGTSTAFCFVMHGKFTPSSLLAFVTGWSRTRSAYYLLDSYGLRKKRSWRERWGEVSAEVERRQRESAGDVQELAMLLQAEMAEDAEYSGHEFDPAVREAWESCLAALDRLAEMSASPEILRQWYHVARGRLKAAVLTEVQHEA
jgi:hypothetical protein